MRFLKSYLYLALVIGLSGCATLEGAEEKEARKLLPTPGKATLYLFWTEPKLEELRNTAFAIFLNQQQAATLDPGVFTKMTIPPGEHTLIAKPRINGALEARPEPLHVTLREGQVYSLALAPITQKHSPDKGPSSGFLGLLFAVVTIPDCVSRIIKPDYCKSQEETHYVVSALEAITLDDARKRLLDVRYARN